jgi:hypothetical protein
MKRKQNFQSIAWFYDLFQRERLRLDPPYQRRSVWNQTYRDYFIDTLLLGYPAPAIFLFEDISPSGVAVYSVVDGKQRLTTIFDFVDSRFPVPQTAERSEYRELYFKDLPDDPKREFFGYQFSVEYIPTEDEAIINNIFNRINRNTAKLSQQELRKARFDGEFITTVQEMSERLFQELQEGFPNIAPQSRRQMKDDELVSHLMLLLEVGARAYSSLDLDEAFSQRDGQWAKKAEVVARFEGVLRVIRDLCGATRGKDLMRTRLRNQADFYSLFGAIDGLLQDGHQPEVEQWVAKLVEFARLVDSEEDRKGDQDLRRYYDAARSASSDTGPRQTRIEILRQVILREASPTEGRDDRPEPH